MRIGQNNQTKKRTQIIRQITSAGKTHQPFGHGLLPTFVPLNNALSYCDTNRGTDKAKVSDSFAIVVAVLCRAV